MSARADEERLHRLTAAGDRRAARELLALARRRNDLAAQRHALDALITRHALPTPAAFGAVRAITVSDDARHAAATDVGGHLALWSLDADGGRDVLAIPPPPGVADVRWDVLFHPDGARALLHRAQQDSARFAYHASDGVVQAWDLTTSARLARFPQGSAVHHLGLAGDLARLITAHDDTLHVWSLDDGARLASHALGGQLIDVRALADPDHVLVAHDAPARDVIAHLHLATGRCARVMRPSWVRQLVVEPGARRVLVSNEDSDTELWSLVDARRDRVLYRAGLTDARFTPDGRRVIGRDLLDWVLIDVARSAAISRLQVLDLAALDPAGERVIERDGDALVTRSLVDGAAHERLIHPGRPGLCLVAPGRGLLTTARRHVLWWSARWPDAWSWRAELMAPIRAAALVGPDAALLGDAQGQVTLLRGLT